MGAVRTELVAVPSPALRFFSLVSAGDISLFFSHNGIMTTPAYEREPGVIAKKDAYRITIGLAQEYILGYTNINGMTDSELSRH